MHWIPKSLSVVVASAGLAFAGVETFPDWKADASNLLSMVQPVRLAAAVSGHEAKFITALGEQIALERARIQLSLTQSPDIWASAQAFAEHKVEMALVRSDDPAAATGLTVFTFGSVHAVFLAPAQAASDSISNLKGRKIGVLVDATGIDPMAKVLLDFYGLDEKNVVRLAQASLADALQRKQVAAILVVGPTGPGAIADAVDAFRKVTKRPPKFLDISEATAITNRFGAYTEDELSPGAFGGSPTVPAEKVTSISSSLVLVAAPSFSSHVAGEVTRLLLATKARTAATLPGVAQLAAPSTDKDVLRPAHPGTIAFLNGEQSDLLDKSINIIFLGSMLTGFLGSFATWLSGPRNSKKDQERQRGMDQPSCPRRKARAHARRKSAPAATSLDELEHFFRKWQAVSKAG
jgi:TRAP-type uncharacterized transport system substrate-binding protein